MYAQQYIETFKLAQDNTELKRKEKKKGFRSEKRKKMRMGKRGRAARREG